jgi:hypothetical protein
MLAPRSCRSPTAFFFLWWMSLAWPGCATALEPIPDRGWQAALGLSAQSFRYAEYAEDGRRLNREHGALPGLALALERPSGPWFFNGALSYHAGDVTYDGQTQSGAPVQTRTDERVLDGSVHLGRWFQTNREPRYAPYVGLGYRWWERDIASTGRARGLLETYTWGYVFIGARAMLHRAGTTTWEADVRLARTIDPQVEVDFNGLFDDTRLSLGARSAARVSLTWQRSVGNGLAVRIRPYWEHWELGRSESAVLTRNDLVVGSVHEPRSETDSYGITISIIASL